MLNNIKTEFTINDLENFSGIKAHTIRIWEKRYNLLNPGRTDTNIRYYNIESLQKLLNISLLYNTGLKISKIADLSDSQLTAKVREVAFTEGIEVSAANSFKLAMLNFDEKLFQATYSGLILSNSFQDVFLKVFMPFLNEIGLLWQVNSITPAHEHFITNLIKQKIHANIDRVQQLESSKSDQVFVLYLPLNEIHELGLLFLHFELLLRGYRSIYLGQSVPVENLNDLQNSYKNICFITFLTVEPSNENIEDYLKYVYNNVLKNRDDNLWVLGYKVTQINPSTFQLPLVKLFSSPFELLKLL